jgi:ABC-type glycerol-3-phosphate transport system substrate-binding protein
MKSNFQIIVIVLFVFAGIFGLLVFSGTIPIGQDQRVAQQGTVVLWGTAASQIVLPLLENFNRNNPSFLVQYVQRPLETFDQDLLEAFASGAAPDLFFVDNSSVLGHANKIFPIPYTSYPLASFKNSFLGAGEVFLTSRGILAFPVSVDPLVMYYNRSILDDYAILYPPTSWEDLAGLVPTLNKKNDLNKIIRSTVALGNFSNVNHAKNIIATLFMQTGNKIVAEKNGNFFSSLNRPLGFMLQFYTDFANPTKRIYSWNRSFQDSRDAFSSEDLAFYFGYASELKFLINRNPNQDFLAAQVPQIKDAKFKTTSTRVTGLAVSSSSKNFNAAFSVASLMATGDFAPSLALAQGIVPARRDSIPTKPIDQYSPVFYTSALYAQSWLDPSPEGTDRIFSRMVEAILSNNISAVNAVEDAHRRLNLLLNR